jgi:hypothetical protein
MSLQAKFFDLVDKATQAESMARDLLAAGDPVAALEECRLCTQLKAQAVLIVRNTPAIAALVGWTEEEPATPTTDLMRPANDS